MLRGLERKRENRNLRLRIGGLNDIIDRERERARERVEEFSACGWRSSARSSRKRTDEREQKKDPELSFFFLLSLISNRRSKR